MNILSDNDVTGLLTPKLAIDAIRTALLEHARGDLVAPPKFNVATPRGRLTYTAGASTQAFNANGFRVYSVYPNSPADTDASQLVAVFDDITGELEGVCVGRNLGIWRTAAINAIAVDALSRPDSDALGVLGAGNQALLHARLALEVRRFKTVRIYNRTQAKAEHLAQQLAQHAQDAAIEVVREASDVVVRSHVVLCTTSAGKPLFPADCVQPGTHINTIGPKFVGRHELGLDIAERADLLVTDCLRQVASYGERFFLATSPALPRLGELSAQLLSPQLRMPDDVSVFVSVGLAGTEVCLGAAILRTPEQEQPQHHEP